MHCAPPASAPATPSASAKPNWNGATPTSSNNLNSSFRLGVLGGTFDPPHIGHLIIAEQAREALHLRTVYFIPAPQPPHKLDQPVTPLQDRLAMLELAVQGNPHFAISLIEVNRAGPSYTVDTLRELRAAAPAASELYFIMGMDSLENLPTWHDPEEIVRLCHLAVFQRPHYEVDLDALELIVPGVKQKVTLLPAPAVDIASHEIQARVREGKSIRYLVPESVARYIEVHELYRDGAEKRERQVTDPARGGTQQ